MKKRIFLLITLLILSSLITVPAVQAATVLKVGSAGSEVLALQTDLKRLGYEVGPLDGIFGVKTKAAVQTFQRDANLQVDGIVGPVTRQALSQTIFRDAKTQGILSTAKSLIGVPYLWGGTTPAGFDCSGYTQYVFAKSGITLPRVSRDQYDVGTSVDFNSLLPGDLVFFSFLSTGEVSHVGIYLGNGQFISATTSKGVTTYSFTPYWKNAYVGARRVY